MMRRVLFSRSFLEHHHTSRCVPAPHNLSLSRFFSSTLKKKNITASDDSISSLPITLDDSIKFSKSGGNDSYDSYMPKHAKTLEEALNKKQIFTTGKRVPGGSRFGQVPVSWPFRFTILPRQGNTPMMVNRVREFHKTSIKSSSNVIPKSSSKSSTKSSSTKSSSKGGGSNNNFPKRTKFQKQHKGRIKGVSSYGNCFARYALQTLEPAWITSRQIEAGRRAIMQDVQRGQKVRVHIFADKPRTVKPTETRMGRGKGPQAFWVAVVKPGKIIYEMDGVTEKIARHAISKAASKMPVRTKMIISN